MGGFTARVGLCLTVLLLCQHVSAELQGRCPAESSPCPARASPCEDDNGCDNEQVCCNTQCGKTCVDPLYTGCENIRLSSERISRALAAENRRGGRGMVKSVRSPRCRTTDGEFEEIQCDNEIVSSCWCVDPTGFEIAGTRAPAAALVNCTGVAPCAAHTCRMLCPLGFELDSKGCPLCKCRDPCTSITCPGQLSCQLEETPCLRPPCPPVPTCKRGRSLQNICPAGEPLLISETSRPFLCGTDPGKPNCPPLYRCLVEKGNDYGVCCPASLELQKAGTCPAPESSEESECGTPCAHDLECPSMQKCCDGGDCGKHCILPHNVTACTQQKMLAELLIVSEREGKGYVPQCGADGAFEPRQCSRNGLVCWCVDSDGNKLRGSMGPASSTSCVPTAAPPRPGGRSLAPQCVSSLCAGVCEYGYAIGAGGCPTCECDDPCEGYPCGDNEECVRVKDAGCTGELCTGYPVCRPRISYENPCETGTPATDDTGSLIACGADEDCPPSHGCSRARRSGGAVCCPLDLDEADNSTDIEFNRSDEILQDEIQSCSEIKSEVESLCGLNSTKSCAGSCPDDQICCNTQTCAGVCVDLNKLKPKINRIDDTPTMCEYLRDFDEKMEGTVDGMGLALPAPTCMEDGSYNPTQCEGSQCWCVDSFGTQIPETLHSTRNSSVDCVKVREELSCLDLTCRMGCDYGFELGTDKCPTCRCRDPCAGVRCPAARTCALVDVACDADYCPPVPACLPKKPGQCPYLVPSNGACEWACKSDSECGPDSRCCATGCGTSCAKAIIQTPCEQRRALALHTAAETGQPPSAIWVPECDPLRGAYERIQCRTSDRVCWCSDEVGNEIQGTRVTNSTPTCDNPIGCPTLKCDDPVQCPYGPELDARGCPTCSCKDPCAEANCREDETCAIVPLDCWQADCPAVARCLPSPSCPWGEPLPSPGAGAGDGGALPCGPHAAACPSTHACRFAPHDSRPPVCCPKPRTVCFESREEGTCAEGTGLNTTRWYFNHEKNRCERFTYQGCSGNHNNFKTKEECNSVCPVLSPCERLREKNEKSAEKYGKGSFIPKCDATGSWEPVQCMQHIDVCWCVNGRGEPLKGSLVRGAKPTCNFRQARKWIRRDPLDEKAKADEVLEELIRQMTAYRIEEFQEDEEIDSIELQPEGRETKDNLSTENVAETISEIVPPKPAETVKNIQKPIEVSTEPTVFKTKCQLLQQEVENAVRPRCMSDGSFSPRQCGRGRCWCVDAAGHRKASPHYVPDHPEPDTCEHTQIESASLEVEVVGVESVRAENARALLSSRLSALGARATVTADSDRGVLRLRAVLTGPRAVDIIYHIETMIKQEKLKKLDRSSPDVLGADVIRTEYRLAVPTPAMQQREILTESTVSATTTYHTALIVLAATSAFIISVLCVLVMLYRARLARGFLPHTHKAERFLPPAPPVYVLSPDEKAELSRVLHAPPPPVPPVPPVPVPHNSGRDDHTRV